MIRDFRIKDNARYEFRNRIYTESLKLPSNTIDSSRYGYELDYIYIDEATGIENIEKIIILDKEPVKLPYTGYFYSRRFYKLNSPLIYDIVRDYVYFNPKMDYAGIKKLTEHMLRFNCGTKRIDSEVRYGEKITAPLYSFEQLFPIVRGYVFAAEKDECELVANVLVAYSKDSIMPRQAKIDFSRRVLSNRTQEMLGNIIHNTANQLISENSHIKVTHPRIIVKANHDKLIFSHTVSRYMQDDTRSLVKKHNDQAGFRNDISYEKYLDFLKIIKKNNDYISKELKISKSKVVAYREFYNKYKNLK